jgi:GntR family transcriptional regulator, transcriptional repressor for pyruvate dehydrogenase complex
LPFAFPGIKNTTYTGEQGMTQDDRTKQSAALVRLAKVMGPIRAEGLTENVVRLLKDCIRRRIITPGERLPPERELAALLKISRGSLRQALKALEVMGVLNVVQGSGAYLADRAEVILRDPEELLVPLRGHSFAEMYEARRAMEAESCACAALRASEQDVEKMRAEIRSMHAMGAAIRKFVSHDNAFHHHIAVASGNSVFIWFIDLLQNVLAKGQLIHARSEQMQASIAEHEAILAAIEAHDPKTARREMLAHLTLSKAYSDRETGLELQVVSPRR